MGKDLEDKLDLEGDGLDDFMEDFSEQSPSSSIIKNMFSKKFPINEKTDITNQEVGIMAQMLMISKKMNVPILKEFVDEFMKLRISLARKGRTEAFEAVREESNSRLKMNTPNMSMLGGRLI